MADERRQIRVEVPIVKTDEDQGRVFGWASVAEVEGELLFDREGDAILPDELEEATYAFVRDARVASDSHAPETIGFGVLIEAMHFSKEKQEILGIDLGKVGTWVGFEILDEDLRKAAREGERLMFSIGGAAVAREPV